MWESLPADALRQILAAMPPGGNYGACRAVCRSWRTVADSSSGVWGSISVRRPPPASSPIPPDAIAILLERQRMYLRRLHLEMGAVKSEDTPPDVAAVLVLAAACGVGSGITDVALACNGSMPSCVLQALPGAASQLTSLTVKPLSGRQAAIVAWSSLHHLGQLSSLSLTVDVSQLGGAAPHLPHLSSLTRLRLQGMAGQPHEPQEFGPALLACPPSLLRLELAAVELRWAGNWPQLHHGLHASMAGLFVAHDGGETDSSAGGAEAEAEADHEGAYSGGDSELDDWDDDVEESSSSEGGEGAHGISIYDAGQRVTSLLAARWQRLEALRIHNCAVSTSLLRVLPSLTALTSLHLAPSGCSLPVVEIAQQCSKLQELVIGRYLDFKLPELPSGALALLTRLRLSGSSEVMKLPASWCSLPNLLSFELESCEQLLHLPVELSTLTQLQRLVFSHQWMEDFPWQLTGLSQLTRLALAACSFGRSLPARPYLQNLQELILFANNLSCVPPALVHPEGGAYGLRRLDLSSNYGHQLSEADVEVVSQLRSLTHLDLRRQQYSRADAHPSKLLQQLRLALPFCDILA